MPRRGALGLTRLDSRSKQSLFSLVPKLMMPWRQIQRQGEHSRGVPKEGLRCTPRQKSKAGVILPFQTPFPALVRAPPPLSSLVSSSHF